MRTWRVYVTTHIERLQIIEAEDTEEAENLARDAADCPNSLLTQLRAPAIDG